ncbi:MAG: hypothetical protein U0P45_17380, partial [Acidimicrobiales bacterium]
AIAGCVLLALGAVAASGAAGLRPGARSTPPTRAAHGTGVTASAGLVAISPCRAFDSRSATAGPLTPGSTRAVQITGSTGFATQGGKATGCGIPDDATAIAVSITATRATGSGYLHAWPHGTTEPKATVLNWSTTGNGGTTTGATLATASQLDLRAFGNQTDLVLDVTGYYVEPMVASVSADGSLITASGGITSSSYAEGLYTLQTTRTLDGCNAVANTNVNVTYTANATASGTTIKVFVHLTTGTTPAAQNFTVSVQC